MDKEAPFLSRFPEIEVSGVGVLLRWVLLQKKEDKSTLILGTCNIISFWYFLLRKEIKRKEGSSGKSERLSFKFSTIGVSGAGVLLRWGSLQKKEAKDTRNTLKILDALLYSLN